MRALLLLIALLVACKDSAQSRVPIVRISVSYDGADAPTVEQAVVVPIERAMSSVPGVESIAARIDGDHATIDLELSAKADMDTAMHETMHRLSAIQPQLPRDVEHPTLTRTQSGDEPVLWLAVGGALPITEVSKEAHLIRTQLQRLAGVGEIELHGIAELSVIVRPDLDKLDTLGVTLFDLVAAVQSANTSIPAGRIDAGPDITQVRIAGNTDLDVLGDVALRTVNGAVVRIRDVAQIESGFQRDSTEAPAIAVRAQYGADRRDVSRRAREELRKLRASLPSGITVEESKSPNPPRARAPLVVSLRGPGLDELRKLADSIAAVAGDDIVRDPPKAEPEQIIMPDRNLLATHGISMVDLAVTLRALAGMHVATFASQNEMHDVTIKGPSTPLQEMLPRIRVRSHDGQLVPLSSLVTTTLGARYVIARRDQERTITLSIYKPRPDARAAIKKQELPPGYRALTR